MKSALQIVVGASILSAAFFVGSRWNQWPAPKAKSAAELQNEDLVWHSLDPHQPGSEVPPVAANGSSPGQPGAKSAANQLAAPERSGRGGPVPSGNEPGPMLPPDATASRNAATNNRGSANLPIAPATSEKVVMPDFQALERSGSGGALPARTTPNQSLGTDQPLASTTPQVPSGASQGNSSLGHTLSAPPLLAQRPPLQPESAGRGPSSVLANPLPPMAEIGPVDPQSAGKRMLGDDSQMAVTPTPNSQPWPARSTTLQPFQPDPALELKLQTDEFRVYLTRAGDTLQRIAEEQLGSANFYLDIYLANQDSLKSPVHVPVGIPLKLPIYRRD